MTATAATAEIQMKKVAELAQASAPVAVGKPFGPKPADNVPPWLAGTIQSGTLALRTKRPGRCACSPVLAR